MHKVKLAAITCELPARSYENDDPVFAAVPDLSESWWQFWGVNRRGYFDPRNGENEFSLVVRAAERLLRSSDTAPDSVDMLICSASSPIMTDAGDVLPDLRGRLYPRMANVLSKQLGLSRALPLDSQMECASFLLNLRLAASMIRQGKAEKVLVVCSEYISNLLDFTSRTSTLFADGCAVALLTRGDDDSCDLLASAEHSDATFYERGHRSLAPAGKPDRRGQAAALFLVVQRRPEQDGQLRPDQRADRDAPGVGKGRPGQR